MNFSFSMWKISENQFNILKYLLFFAIHDCYGLFGELCFRSRRKNQLFRTIPILLRSLLLKTVTLKCY
ncbi:hypothetical protein VNO78_00283 [Psophocarpus tetragonolobus]|uniref:Uncharacterized protein n=1 Tax=Psophocarpus tetragonolobus TaxID=3891 RepID=A0AAN9SZ78_PSOTE